ncbi:MAG: hypothetical protein WBV10_10660 [Exiguobacterium marinum]|uniref:hypothetical protein n=1 Tax=Exiguobacterium marinum TaxID=273528 RepID=UPI003C6B36F5
MSKVYNDTYGHLVGDACIKWMEDECWIKLIQKKTTFPVQFGSNGMSSFWSTYCSINPS